MNRAKSVLLAAVAACALAVPAAAEAPAPVRPMDPRQVTVDHESLAQERATNTAVEDVIRAMGAEAATAAPRREIDLRQAALAALERNISIRRAQLAPAYASQALREAKALFDPVFTVSVNASSTSYQDRSAVTEKFHQATIFIPYQQTLAQATNGADSRDRDLPCNRPAGCYRVYNPKGSTVMFQEFDEHRPASYSQSRVAAAERSKSGSDFVSSATISVTQALPWGVDLSLGADIVYNDTAYVLNADNPARTSYGRYGRPWTFNTRIGVAAPLPFTAGWGSGDPETRAVRVAEINQDGSKWTTLATINETLYDVEGVYWSLVGAAHQLQVVNQSLILAERAQARTAGLYNRQEITEADMAQVDAQVSALRASRQAAWASYVRTSNALHELMHGGSEPVLYVPVGWSAALAAKDVVAPDAERVLENPAYKSALTQIALQSVNLDYAEQRTWIEASATASLSFRQNGSKFGYRTLADAVSHLDSPDSTAFDFSLVARDYIGNQSDLAAWRAAQASRERAQLSAESVALSLRTAFRAALADLDSARARMEIAQRHRDLAADVYERAQRFYEIRRVTEYELMQKLADLNTAEISAVSARVQAELAESNLLRLIGALPNRFGERTAQTEFDRDRVRALLASGQLQTFGGIN